jgi:ferritin-like metal-binding protein YciE
MVSMNLTTLTDLILEQLAGLYDAEQQLVEALPLMAEKAFSEELRDGITQHLEETKEHVKRLESAFKLLKTPAKRKRCQAMEGLVADAKTLLKAESTADPDVLDASLICAAQLVEHFEIGAYGTVCSHARLLEAHDLAELLEETLDEEKETDRKLTELAENVVNLDAAEADEEVQRQANGEDEEEEEDGEEENSGAQKAAGSSKTSTQRQK